jgi:hypothetical protein
LAFGVQTHQLTTFGVVVFDDQVDGAFSGVVDAHLQVVARALDAHVLGRQVGVLSCSSMLRQPGSSKRLTTLVLSTLALDSVALLWNLTMYLVSMISSALSETD